MATYRYYMFYCDGCELQFEDMKDISDTTVDNEKAECPNCAEVVARIPFATIAKGEIEERVHGGRMTNGKLYRQHTGFKEVAAQNAAEKRMKRAKARGDKAEETDAKKELTRLRNDAKKELTK
jgi:hypothetical protein